MIGQDYLLKFKLSITMEKKGDLSDFQHGMVVGARRKCFLDARECPD